MSGGRRLHGRIDVTRSAGGRFTAELLVNAAGFVTRYASFWQAEATT